MLKLQIIGHKPTLIDTETGKRKSFKDMQMLADQIRRTDLSKYEGLEQLPKFYQEYIGYQPAEPEIGPDHIVQLTEGGLS